MYVQLVIVKPIVKFMLMIVQRLRCMEGPHYSMCTHKRVRMLEVADVATAVTECCWVLRF